MSNKSRLQTNNENLQLLIDKANELPDAGSGGGVETCMVAFSYTSISLLGIIYTSDKGGVVSSIFDNASTGTITINDIVKNSALVIYAVCVLPNISTTGGITTLGYEMNVTQKAFAFNVSDDGTITMRDDD